MLGRKNRAQMDLFITGSLERLIPADHILARVNRVLDLSWLREEVADCYCADNGRPGVDPEVAVRLMLAGLLLRIVHDRRLLREAQVNIAIRWFIGYGLEDRLPDHSSLTRIRQRWGEARFREIFRRTVVACLDAKVAKAEVVHVDASLIRAGRELGEPGGASRGRGDSGEPLGGGGREEGGRRPPGRGFGAGEPDGPGRAPCDLGRARGVRAELGAARGGGRCERRCPRRFGDGGYGERAGGDRIPYQCGSRTLGA